MVCAHLSPNSSQELYIQSLTDMEELLELHPTDHVILAVDAQDGVGQVDDDMEFAGIVGPYGDGKQGWKGLEFCRAMHEYGLRVLNTLFEDEMGPCTCHFFLRSQPAQIDFICSNLPRGSVQKCGKFDCEATPTDHWPLRMSVASRSRRRVRQARALKHEPKPIGWVLHDSSFHSKVMERLLSLNTNGEQTCTTSVDESDRGLVTCCFTDGSCFAKRRSRTAGWGFVVFEPGLSLETIRAGVDPSTTAYGPVQLSSDERLYVGAKVLSNNTAELSAIIELCFWALATLESASSSSFQFDVYSDSSYVVGLVNGKFAPKENIHISLLAVHMVQQVRRKTRMKVSWIKAHAGWWGNELADQAAKAGATPSNHAEFWIRNIDLHSWGEQDFASLLQIALGSPESAGCGSLTASRFQGADEVSRETLDGTVVPSLGVITKVVAEVVKSCGKSPPKNQPQLPDDDPALSELKEWERLRRQERCGVIRHWYSSQVAKARRKLQRRAMTLRCQQAAEAGRSCKDLSSKRQRRKYMLSYFDREHVLHKEYDPAHKANLLFSFYYDLFKSSNPDVPEWVHARWSADVLREVPALTGSLVRLAALGCHKRKSCAEDHVVFEMLHALDQEFFDILAYAFRFRLLNHFSESGDDVWESNVITLEEQRVGASFITDFRSITALLVLYR